jgi:hypothetical protein
MKQKSPPAYPAGRNQERTAGDRDPVPCAGAPERLRRLKQGEVVSQGDFVANGQLGFELWEGPSGFQARAFLKRIYRRHPDPASRSKPPRAS